MISSTIIIDTDLGVDDALAIMFAHASEKLDILGITTIYGNQTLEKTTMNACAIVDILKAKMLVYPGADKPTFGRMRIAESHGESGLGGYKCSGLMGSGRPKTLPQKQNAVDFLAQNLVKGRGVQMACLAPLTNITMLLRKNPDALAHVEQVVIMGGVFGEPGNVSPWAEFNIFNDPEALQQVLAVDDIRKVLIPANICRKVMMDEKDFLHMKDKTLSKTIRDIVREFVEYYRNDHIYGGFTGGVMYDALVIAYILWPELFTVNPRHVLVDTGDSVARGATAIDLKKQDQPNCFLVEGVEAEEVKRRLLQLLA